MSKAKKPGIIHAKPLEPASSRGRQTQKAIVAAAEDVLVQHGHAGFTLKRVADKAGIAVGNLSYHFPSKDLLLELLVDQTLAAYANRFATLIKKDPHSTAGIMAQLTAWFIEDSSTERYTHLFRELWAAALHSPPLNAALERFYDKTIADVVSLVSPSVKAKREELEALVYLMCMLSEGASVVFGARKRTFRQFKEVTATAQKAVRLLTASIVSEG